MRLAKKKRKIVIEKLQEKNLKVDLRGKLNTANTPDGSV